MCADNEGLGQRHLDSGQHEQDLAGVKQVAEDVPVRLRLDEPLDAFCRFAFRRNRIAPCVDEVEGDVPDGAFE